MQAVLIFAGKSKRFWPLSEKSLFPVCGTTLLEEQVRRLRASGIKKILLVGGEHNHKEAKALFPELTLVLQEDLDLGMRGALLSALPHCADEPVLIVSANDLVEVSAYKELLKRTKRMKDGGAILAKKVSTYFPGGYLSVKKNRITNIIEKPEPGKEPSDLINLVAHIHLSPATLLDTLKKARTKRDDGYEVALAALLKKYSYEAVMYEGVWKTVKYPWHLLDVLQVLSPVNKKPQIHRTADIHRSAVIEGSVMIGPHVKVLAHASIIGPCVIGEGTIVANNALVRGSSIGKNCVIGYNTEVARSVIGNDVWTHSSYLGDSVLGNDVSLGAGTTTGNLRLDETVMSSVIEGKNVDTGRVKLGVMMGNGVRTGIHTCTAPGVKIGKNTFINGQTMIIQDIPDDSFVKIKESEDLDIRKNKHTTGEMRDRKTFREQLK